MTKKMSRLPEYKVRRTSRNDIPLVPTAGYFSTVAQQGFSQSGPHPFFESGHFEKTQQPAKKIMTSTKPIVCFRFIARLLFSCYRCTFVENKMGNKRFRLGHFIHDVIFVSRVGHFHTGFISRMGFLRRLELNMY